MSTLAAQGLLGRSSEAPQNRESQIPSESSAGQHDDCEYDDEYDDEYDEYHHHGVFCTCRSTTCILAGKYL